MTKNYLQKYRALGIGWKLLIHVGLIGVVFGVILWIASICLDVWTRHGEYVVVPDVTGVSYNEAVAQLEGTQFEVVLKDSIYDDSFASGTVIDQNPKELTKVRPGRTIYLTIVGFSQRTVMVPTLINVSERQAKATLNGLGLKKFTIKTVKSEYRGLVVNATCDGKRLVSGMRVPLKARIVLEVGEGSPDQMYDYSDSLGGLVLVDSTMFDTNITSDSQDNSTSSDIFD